jgi:DNA-binding XRE family transcriptional regulator
MLLLQAGCHFHGATEAETMTMRRIIRTRKLTSEEAAAYRKIRRQVAAELPELVTGHRRRTACVEQLDKLLGQLKAARRRQGLSLSDLTELTGMDRPALSKLETGKRCNPTIDTLVRYADAVGKKVVVSLADEE